MKIFEYKFDLAKSGVFVLFALCLLGFNSCSGGTKITESEVLDLLNKIELAAKNKDAEAVVANMSEKAEIKATVTTAGQTQTLKYNRDQYREFLKNSFVQLNNYTYSRQNTRVKIAPDGRTAIVTEEISESMTFNGQTIRTLSSEVASLAIEDGKIVTRYIEIIGKQV
jgi:hypothetical protein